MDDNSRQVLQDLHGRVHDLSVAVSRAWNEIEDPPVRKQLWAVRDAVVDTFQALEAAWKAGERQSP
jgi:hypothetical protein